MKKVLSKKCLSNIDYYLTYLKLKNRGIIKRYVTPEEDINSLFANKELSFNFELTKHNIVKVLEFIYKYEMIPESLDEINNFNKLMEL